MKRFVWFLLALPGLTLGADPARTGPALPGAAAGDGDLVECANLIYAGTKSSVCFSEEFLSAVAAETSINTARKFKPVKLGEKELFYEQAVRVTLIEVDPAAAADATRGTVERRLVEAVDIVPTILQATGLDPAPHLVEGRSLLPLLRGEAMAQTWRDCAFSELDYAFRGVRQNLQCRPDECYAWMARTDRWKYVHHQGLRPQLFDLADDPMELVDRGDDPALAGVRREDVDVAEIYDSFTYTVLLSLEDLGFCAKGEGGAFVSGQRTAPGGTFPMNTQGGGLSYTHPGMFGIFTVIEAVRQLRGDYAAAGQVERQVRDATIALAHGTGGVLSATGTAILTRM